MYGGVPKWTNMRYDCEQFLFHAALLRQRFQKPVDTNFYVVGQPHVSSNNAKWIITHLIFMLGIMRLNMK